MQKKSHYIPDYEVKGSQAAEYGVGYSKFLDHFRDGEVSGLGEISEKLRRIKQEQKYNISPNAKRANLFAQELGLPPVISLQKTETVSKERRANMFCESIGISPIFKETK